MPKRFTAPNSYREWMELFNSPLRYRDGVKLANNTRAELIRRPDGGLGSGVRVTLHGNKIAEIHQDGITAYSCGWRTVTTKDRLCGILPGGCWQVNGEWHTGAGVFYEGIFIGWPA